MVLLANGHFAWVTPAIFVIFVNIRRLRSKVHFFVGRMQFPNFRQNHLFSVADKNTVFQNDRFDNPKLEPVPTWQSLTPSMTG